MKRKPIGIRGSEAASPPCNALSATLAVGARVATIGLVALALTLRPVSARQLPDGEPPTVGLALSGGVAKGFAHVEPVESLRGD